jgi:hypothetical protein
LRETYGSKKRGCLIKTASFLSKNFSVIVFAFSF